MYETLIPGGVRPVREREKESKRREGEKIVS